MHSLVKILLFHYKDKAVLINKRIRNELYIYRYCMCACSVSYASVSNLKKK